MQLPENNTGLSPEQLYNQLNGRSFAEQLELVTKRLIEITSVTDTKGENDISSFLYQFLQQFPCFKTNPGDVWKQTIPGDDLQRKNIFAFVSSAEPSPDTVIFHAHYDTVGITDYGNLQSIAGAPERLKEYFFSQNSHTGAAEDALGDDWLFGRGSVDMKSGIAVHLLNFLYYSTHGNEWKGNILLLLNAGEENDHSGMKAAVEEFLRLRRERNLHYSLAVNNDYTTSLYEGDPNYYAYLGSAGKMLACFSIFGRPVHAGEVMEGLDPTFISSALNQAVSYNTEFMETIPGEFTLPPVCLQQKDSKQGYNVQTAENARMYFNYFLYEESIEGAVQKLYDAAEKAAAEIAEDMKKRYDTFLEKTGKQAGTPPSWEIRIEKWDTYCGRLERKGIDVRAAVEKAEKESETLDAREKSFYIAEAVKREDPDKSPLILLFLSAPLIPPVAVKKSDIQEKLQTALEAVQKTYQLRIAARQYFPFISDSSFLSLENKFLPGGERAVVPHMPGGFKSHQLPLQAMKELAVPAVNLGVYGRDAHQYTERLYKPYSFEILPYFIRRVVREFL
ncbi:arginine utilization protein RocB [Sinobaca qinghaiensis]|uniref:Arginine utilization protein RocB n=1 Tax=Sinobaca qinghaiensis TaxID=342944 RepID=A0A419UZG6_9BACL|nr:M20/M25/M40 family metallo-hydrolase [Sinobaca qinghaiensis]RKD71086.1 arginine utilization protein RocB [Sinobaca qinghaiensis]